MKDRIVEGYLKDFCDTNGLQRIDQSKAFEHFVNFCVVSREHPENFDFERVSVGGPGDCAIDGIAILVNDHIVSLQMPTCSGCETSPITSTIQVSTWTKHPSVKCIMRAPGCGRTIRRS